MTRPPSILVRLIREGANALAQQHQVPHEKQQAYIANAESVFLGPWLRTFGGETVRIYSPRETQSQRDARRQRIAAALRAGESPRSIAKRENVSASWVHRLAKVTAAGMERSQAE